MYTITAQKRDPAAKAKQLRRAGFVPGVIYGAELDESLSIQIDQSTARQLKRTKRNGSKVNIQVGDKLYPSLIKDFEYNIVNDEIVHISFHVLDADRKYNSVADISLLNKDKVAGILEQVLTQVPHAARPRDLLDVVTVDLENLPIGTTLTVGDIPEFQSDKIELQMSRDAIVLRIREKKRADGSAAG